MALTRWRECGYAAAEGGLSATETFIRLHFLFYLTNELLLSPAIAGLLVSMGVLWDGLIDPIAGWLSDRTCTPWGRRTPYLLLGLFLLPLLLTAVFLPQFKAMQGLSQILAVGGVYLLLNTAMTLIGVPHAALGGDLSLDEARRTRIFAWRYFFTTVGLLAGIAVPSFFMSRHGPAPAAYWQSAAVLGGFALVATMTTIIASAKADRTMKAVASQTSHHPLTMLRGLMANRPFLILITAFILATVGQAINSSLALYYYRLHLQLSEKDIEQVLVLFTLVIILSIVGWNLLSRRFEKVHLLAIGVGLMGITGSIAYPLMPSKGLQAPLVMAVLGGLFLGSVFLLEVMVTDAVDYGAVRTGSADYGSYFGLWKLGTKIARAIAIGVSGLLLELIGFHPGVPPGPDTLQGLALLFGPGVGIFFIAGAFLVLFYPLKQVKVLQLHRILHARRSGND